MIKEIGRENIPECVSVIRESFKTVADEFGFTEKNAPRFTAFAITETRLNYQLEHEKRKIYGFFSDGGTNTFVRPKLIGCYSLLVSDNGECELNNLCVLPNFRHLGIGSELLDDCLKRAADAGSSKMNIGIVEENTVLRKWYEDKGFVHTNTMKFDFFPFTCGYMEKVLQQPSAQSTAQPTVQDAVQSTVQGTVQSTSQNVEINKTEISKEENKMNETTVTFRIDAETKAKAEMLFSMLGLDLETACQVFLKRSVAEKGLPFSMNMMKNEPAGANIPNPKPDTVAEKVQNMFNDGVKQAKDFFDNITK